MWRGRTFLSRRSVMKVQRFLLVGVALLMASASPAWAQRVRTEVQPRVAQGRGDAQLLASEAVEKLKFTNEQKEKYTKIEADYKDKVKVVQDKFRTDIQG